MITDEYKNRYFNVEDAYKRAYRDLDEMIDVFNTLDSYISEIDLKSKKYIDSTIGKIKFLLAEDDNITGKLNTILRYIKFQNKHNKIDSAISSLQSLFTLKSYNPYNQESSLYTPRGKYTKVQSRALDLDSFDFDSDLFDEISSNSLECFFCFLFVQFSGYMPCKSRVFTRLFYFFIDFSVFGCYIIEKFI